MPRALPMKSWRPTSKTVSGSSVRISTPISPLSPWTFRVRPTMTSSEDAIGDPGSIHRRPRSVGFLRKRNGRRGKLPAEARLVTGLEHTGAPQERTNGVGRLRALVEPVVGSIVLEVERGVPLTRSILADDLDETTVARALGISNHDTEIR